MANPRQRPAPRRLRRRRTTRIRPDRRRDADPRRLPPNRVAPCQARRAASPPRPQRTPKRPANTGPTTRNQPVRDHPHERAGSVTMAPTPRPDRRSGTHGRFGALPLITEMLPDRGGSHGPAETRRTSAETVLPTRAPTRPRPAPGGHGRGSRDRCCALTGGPRAQPGGCLLRRCPERFDRAACRVASLSRRYTLFGSIGPRR